MYYNIFLLLGTNLGDKTKNLDAAIQQIESQVGKLVAKSSLYVTKAWGKTNQPDFYNQVVQAETTLSAHELLNAILDIEKSMGRNRTEKWGERVIDIDILFYEDMILKSESLSIPHPEIVNRRFTLVPLAEIAPSLIHPVYKTTIQQLLDTCGDSLLVEKIRN